ncbi:MAG: peroxiredoxin family protein [Reyranella sp.]|nr:peroxiredoxin family protein [Reyranella sp.]
MPTLLTEQGETAVQSRRASGEDLWLSAGDLERATGWALKPEGFCKGEVCVPVPPHRAGEFVAGDEVNAASLWRHMDLPLAHDASTGTWVLGESAASRSAQLQSLEAPDFTLPDLAGQRHSLAEQRGKKVLLVSWASW